MKLLRNLQNYPQFAQGSVAAIGNFDGVHLGHQHLLQSLHQQAKSLGLPLLVIIFEPQAREFFLGEKAPPRVAPFRDKLAFLQNCQVDYVLCLRFNQRLANMQADEFAERVIFSSLNVKHLIVGSDFKFGKNRSGDLDLLQRLSTKYACEVAECSDFKLAESKISSTRVRELLRKAQFSQVKALLGRDYSIRGRVIRGDANARKWGAPTANLNITQLPLSLKGVYCVQIKRKKGNILNGVANVGRRPTVAGNRQLLEVHIFDFNESLYGEELEVFFLQKIRDEIKFASIDDLVQQILQDVELAKEYFLTRNTNE